MQATTSLKQENRWRQDLRIIGVLAQKDIVDSLKNKNTLTVIITVSFMILFYYYMPVLSAGASFPDVLVYDAGNPELMAALERTAEIDLYDYRSEVILRQVIADDNEPGLGLVLPPGASGGSEPLELEGYLAHWVDADAAAELIRHVEAQFSAELGRPVTINVAGNTVYPTVESFGVSFTLTMSVMFTMVMLGVSMIPHLMLEEKRAKTLVALLVSPATPAQITFGKALAGAFWGLIAAVGVIAFYQALILHWWLAGLALISSIFLAVGVGLFVGTLIDNKQQLMLLGWFLVLPLLIPIFLSMLTDLLPAWLLQLMQLVPTVALSNILRAACALDVTLADYGPDLAISWAFIALAFAAVIWLIRRSDR